MAIYPASTSVPMQNPVAEGIQFRTLITPIDSNGDEQRKQKWLFPRRQFAVKYESLELSEGRTLWQFYLNRKGCFESFSFYYPLTWTFQTYGVEYVGVGDGATLVFNLPCVASTVRVVRVAAIIQTEGVPPANYAFSPAGGTDGNDLITFVVAPAIGAIVDLSFTGTLRVTCRFAEDITSFETFYNRLVTLGVKLQGLLNA